METSKTVMQDCRVCGTLTSTVFNIKMNAVPICERCANSIFMQQAEWLGIENAKKIKCS